MEKEKFIRHFDLATKFLIDFTQQYCFNTFSENHKFIIVPNSRTPDKHLTEQEVQILNTLNKFQDVCLSRGQVIDLVFQDNKVPLWINFEVYETSKVETIFNLVCSRRFRDDTELNYKADQYPPFHPLVSIPPPQFRIEKNGKYDINYQKRLKQFQKLPTFIKRLKSAFRVR